MLPTGHPAPGAALNRGGPVAPKSLAVSRGSAARSRIVTAQAGTDEQAELERLMEENRRLRQIMQKTAQNMEPQQVQRFTSVYKDIASKSEKLGLGADRSLLQQPTVAAMQTQTVARESASTSGGAASASVSTPSPAPTSPGISGSSSNGGSSSHGSSSAQRGGAVASGSGAGGVTAAAPPPPVPKTVFTQEGAEVEPIDSASYLRDVMTMSVDLDAEDDGEDDDMGSSKFSRAAQFKRKLEQDAKAEPKVLPDSRPKEAARVTAADPRAAERKAARELVATHTAAEVLKEKMHWMVVTVPEKPVAGEDCVIYFNRAQSLTLKQRPRIVLTFGFNKWELEPEGGSSKVDLLPATVPRTEGSDFWSCKIKVPEPTFELNFVLFDGEHTYENNGGQDFLYPVSGITPEEWKDIATEIKLRKEEEKAAAAAAAAIEAERQRQAELLEQDRTRGLQLANEVRNNYAGLQAGGTSLLKAGEVVVFKVEPEAPRAGDKITLHFNIKASPLGRFVPFPAESGPTVMYGFNGWKYPGKVQLTFDKHNGAVQVDAAVEWWTAQIDVPFEAAAVNFVLCWNNNYDNNGSKDYKISVGHPAKYTFDQWADQLAENFRKVEFETRMKAETEAKEKEARKAAARRRAQDNVKAVERRKVRHVLYTEPEVVKAGGEVTVFYNPQDTGLRGRDNVYLIGGWNRWTHPKNFGPIQMDPPAPGQQHFKATVTVPKDAFKMDFVFSDVAGGAGTYDNRGGLDYHLPIEDSKVKEPSLHVVHISVEMAPVAKVGGLGDVVTALGRAVQDQGHCVEVILPRYEFFAHSPLLAGQLKYEAEYEWGGTRIFVTTAMVEGLRVFFIEPKNGFFDTPTVYGRYDDEVRFDFFCKAALEFLLRTGRQPDILHCHDWSTAHVAKSFWDDYQPYGLWKPRVCFTIHNLNYGQKKLAEAAFYCQKFTTVSPTYALEIGGNPIIAPQAHKFMGIINGIDSDLWSPEDNKYLPMNYTSQNVVEGKKAARQALRQRVGLSGWGDKFIVAVISRLTGQKGVPLIKHAAFRAIDRGGQFVLLGSAPDPKVQGEFNEMAQRMNGDNARFEFKYDEPLSHLIYAAADMIVVPSMFEPCGLTQMIAMRYGTVPIVRHTGGLRDSVFDVDFDKARAAWDVYGSSNWERDQLDGTNGFAFGGTDDGALDYAMNRAIDAWYNDRAWFHGLQKRVMEQDWTWNKPALDYIELYHAAKKA